LQALGNNRVGLFNTAVGSQALYDNSAGSSSTAVGNSALLNNTTGGSNTAIGNNALLNNTTGATNIAIGESAGSNLTTGNDNIDLYDSGVAGESSTIRIGTVGIQTATFVAGISGAPISSGAAVLVSSTGQLGVKSSSARYKGDIHDMSTVSDNLMRLRPVSFRYKKDPARTRQYGLIAEEVVQIYPELVVRGIDGKPEAVEYEELPVMLLNELQKQSRALAAKDAQIKALSSELEALKHGDGAIAERLDALERQVRASSPQRVALAPAVTMPHELAR
jgi:hypothetical protein